MRIDNRFFNRVIFIATLFSIVLIAWFTWRGSNNHKTDFITKWINSTELNNSYIRLLGSNDSTRFANIQKPAIIYFWAGWSDLSINGLRELAQIKPKSLTLIALLVKDNEEAESRLDSLTSSAANLSYGTYLYLEKHIPAVPTLIYVDESGKIADIQIGHLEPDELSQLPYLKKDEN
jgi:hypothetical protein